MDILSISIGFFNQSSAALLFWFLVVCWSFPVLEEETGYLLLSILQYGHICHGIAPVTRSVLPSTLCTRVRTRVRTRV